VTSEVDDEEEAKDHADREDNILNKDSIDANTKEGLEDFLNKIKQAIDNLNGKRDLLDGDLGLLVLTILEVGNNTHAIHGESSKKSKECNPADKAKDSEIVADKENKEDIDGTENSKGLHEILPHEDLLELLEELALLEGLSDHLAGAFARARGSGSRLFSLGLFCCGLFSGLFFLDGSFNGCGFTFFRHLD